MKKNYLVGYDIADPKRLAKIAKITAGFGYRIQYSFFHCFISARQKKRLKSLLNQIINEQEDQIMILPINEKQLKDIEFIGFKIHLETEGIIVL